MCIDDFENFEYYGTSNGTTEEETSNTDTPEQTVIPPTTEIIDPEITDTQANESSTMDEPVTTTTVDNSLGRGMRTKFPSTRLKDFVTHTVLQKAPSKVPPCFNFSFK